MNSLSIEYFVMVAHVGSFSRAAIELGIEQSTLSRYVSKLESDTGVRLFHRSGRGVVLTDAGRVFLEQAQQMVDALEKTRELAGALSGHGPSQLVVAAQPTIAQLLYGDLAHVFKENFAGIRLQMLEGLGHQLVGWLVEGKVDVAILYVPTQAHVVNVDPLLQEPLYCISAPGYALPAEDLSMEQLLDLPMVLPSTPHGLRAILETAASSHRRTVSLAIECDGSIEITKRLVEAGHGCTILPLAGVQREIQQKTLKATRIAGNSLTRTIAIATAKNRPQISSNWGINQMIRRVISDHVQRQAWPGVSALTA